MLAIIALIILSAMLLKKTATYFDYAIVLSIAWFISAGMLKLHNAYTLVIVIASVAGWHFLNDVAIFRVKIFKILGALLAAGISAWWLVPSIIEALPFIYEPLDAEWLIVIRVVTVLLVLFARAIQDEVIVR